MKAELKETRKQRDDAIKKLEENSSLASIDEKLGMVHTALEQVINEIEVNQKAKDLLEVLMKILGYSPEDIKRIIGNKSVKTKKFGFF